MMPVPTPSDPLYCPGSGTRDYTTGSLPDEVWQICSHCHRALKPRKSTLRAHRVRSRTTASLDRTRDVLAGIDIRERP